jgi:PadR family transcriptional regulator AphA
MSIQYPADLASALTPTSYLVLGLLAREGSSTPYELKRHVAATIGHFWSFPHALLYKEPARLVQLGLATEERELDGRRRRLFSITDAGRAALRWWLGHPVRQPTELRDLALLQLFFADLEPTAATLAIATAQLELHREQLAGYEADARREKGLEWSDPTSRTVEHWRGVTLKMGLLYERAAVEFWSAVAAGADAAETATDRGRAEDDGASVVTATADAEDVGTA